VLWLPKYIEFKKKNTPTAYYTYVIFAFYEKTWFCETETWVKSHKSLERTDIKNLNLLYYLLNRIIPDSYKNQWKVHGCHSKRQQELMWTVVDGIESSCLGKSRICSSWTKDTLSPQHSCRARKKYSTWQSKVAAAKKPWRPRPLSPAAHSTDRRMEEWAPRITCHEPRNAPESVSVPASVRAERGHCGNVL